MAVMMLRSDTPSIDQVLAKAHQLLLRDKRHVRNRVAYEQGEFEDTDKRRRAQSDICSHLSRGKHLHTVKQPILRLVDESPVAFEFLSRYSNGVAEMPDTFFRLCSERNILTLVDHHCLRRAVAASAELPGDFRFHVNLFPSTMISIPAEHLLETFPHPIPARTFCVEISEQQIIGEPSYLLGPVRALRNAGLLIAIDDVGFGNSCLESLVILEPDIIKIDKRCVIGLGGDSTRIQYLQRYLTLARTLGAEIVAEGIEGQEELSVMRDLGVEYGQGFLWGQPS
jgi:EAL domain-containing protein (putative c-di-GMP-specific phosphodiesterase class I)